MSDCALGKLYSDPGLEQNPQIVPPSLDLSAATADLAAYDQLRPLLERLQRLTTRLDDTVTALGSDTMDVALRATPRSSSPAPRRASKNCAANCPAASPRPAARRSPPSPNRPDRPHRSTPQAASGRPVCIPESVRASTEALEALPESVQATFEALEALPESVRALPKTVEALIKWVIALRKAVETLIESVEALSKRSKRVRSRVKRFQ